MLAKVLGVGVACGAFLSFGQPAQTPPGQVQEAVTRYCTGCHNDRARTAGLALNPAALDQDSATGEKVVRKLRMRTMPPAGAPRPDEATYQRLTTWLETRLDQAAAANPKPGSPLLHRLNRTEYANAIEDLLGLKVDVTELLAAGLGYRDGNMAVPTKDRGTPEDAISALQLCLDSGLDINATGASGDTALHFAINGREGPDVARYLMEHGANATTKNARGQTPLDAAKSSRKDRRDIVKLLSDR